MTKTKLQQELKEKVKPGIKPSQLKRSKSSEEIPHPNLTTPPLQKSKSAQDILQQPSLSEQVKSLKQELVFSQTTAQNYLTNLQQTTAQLDNTKLEIKELKEEFAEQIKQLKTEKEQLAQENNQLVDKNNELRLQALKDFDEVRENKQGIEQAVNQLVNTEQTQINYQVQNGILLREKKDLEQRLKSANERIQKLYQLKGLPNNVQAPFIKH
jgi:chromosome segregation ATPase